MPIDPARLDLLRTMIDERLKLSEQEAFTDSPPAHIHGEGEKADQDLWGPKTRVPVPIEKI